jgi:Txe/YoeB family toxin of Txe-Axe toxin-antitoxin module
MSKTLKFQQITDSRFEDNILELLKERIIKIKNLLKIEGVMTFTSEPYLVDWSNTSEGNIQYRADFFISKNTNKTTWSEIYKLVNSVNAVPYKLI